ncbi:hypothetical protein PFMG_02916 [Plasmodium falciparum IGH-CR14]|uniref:Uncharacterized protein n=1 Tax=Plasmodium falciparum IGH-CR14 TaxID=580059 RepID=A0A0L1ICA4_PLAFA|nr:hypothetical protein PFMG_02916 [Plasmodium falciparum IGH-CR14]
MAYKYINVDTESKKVSNKNEKSQTTIKENTKAAGNLDVNNENKKSDRRTNVKVNQPPGGASSRYLKAIIGEDAEEKDISRIGPKVLRTPSEDLDNQEDGPLKDLIYIEKISYSFSFCPLR